MMTFPTISAGTRANEAIGGYANFVAYCNALAAGVDSVTTTAAGAALKANNLSDVASAETARTNLGLGTMATAAASDYLSKAGNLSGIADPAAARTNLGLGTMATASASAYAALAGATFTGDLIVSKASAALFVSASSGNANAVISGAAGTERAMQLQTAGLLRWKAFTTSSAESGSNAGSNFGLWSYNDAGNFLRDVLSISRSSGAIDLKGNLVLSGVATGSPVLVSRGVAAQVNPLFEGQNSGGSVLASISAAGAGTFSGLTVAAGYDINASHTAVGNTRYGVGAVRAAATGTYNTGVGLWALTSLTSGGSNTAIGQGSMYAKTTGSNNVAVGQGALYTDTNGVYNTALGKAALTILDGGSYNSALGGNALVNATSAANNIALGYAAGMYSTTQSNEIFINSLNRSNRAGDIANSIIWGQQAAAAADQILTLNASVAIAGAASLGGGKGVMFIGNANTVPTSNPTGGGILYVESGALKFRGSSGTVSIIAPA